MAIKKTIKNERHQVIHPITEVSAVEGLSEALAQKQDLLNSGVNIKTINGESILGPGNMIIDGGGSTISVDTEMSATSENPVQNKVITQAISGFITKSVDDLVNYYLKSETYNKTEVDSLIAAVNQFSYEVAASLPTASASTMYKIYLIPSSRPETQNVKDEYITIRSGSEGSYTYSWEQIGSTAIDLSDYVTTSALNTALADYTTTAQLNTLLAAKQDVINDLSTIRSGAAAGATAYQKPSGGIPKSDLNSGVQASLDLADSAVQADPVGSVTPPVTPSDWATAEQVEELEAKLTKLVTIENEVPDYQYNGYDQNTMIYDNQQILPVGASIKKVKLASTGTAAPKSTKIVVFDENNTQVSRNEIGTIGTTPVEFDISALGIVIRSGYKYCVECTPYKYVAGTTGRYSMVGGGSESAYNNYYFGFAFVVETTGDRLDIIEAETADLQQVSEKNETATELLDPKFVGEESINPGVAESGKFVNATNNELQSSEDFDTSDSIELASGQTIKLTARGYSTVIGMINLYKNGAYETVVPSIDDTEREYSYTADEICEVRVCYGKNYNHSVEILTTTDTLLRVDKIENEIEELGVISGKNNSSINLLEPIHAGSESINPGVAVANSFVNATNNRVDSNSNFEISENIELGIGQTIKLTATGYSTVVGMISLYHNGAYEVVVPSIDSSEHEYTYTATEICTVRVCYGRALPHSIVIVTSEDALLRIDRIEQELSETEKNIFNYPYLFTNVACVGDSLTKGSAGQNWEGDHGVLSTNYPFYFGKMADAQVSNLGLPGRTTKQWWDEYNEHINFATYDCVIIYLGTNGGLTDTASTDINTSDYSQCADTNTGCYGKIIGKIKAESSKCSIFVVAGPNDYVNRTAMDKVVRDIAEICDVALLDLENCSLSDNGSTSSASRYIYRPIDAIHYNRLGYFTLASEIFDKMKVVISENLIDYNQTQDVVS